MHFNLAVEDLNVIVHVSCDWLQFSNFKIIAILDLWHIQYQINKLWSFYCI